MLALLNFHVFAILVFLGFSKQSVYDSSISLDLDSVKFVKDRSNLANKFGALVQQLVDLLHMLLPVVLLLGVVFVSQVLDVRISVVNLLAVIFLIRLFLGLQLALRNRLPNDLDFGLISVYFFLVFLLDCASARPGLLQVFLWVFSLEEVVE